MFYERILILCVLQVMTLYNAQKIGWQVRKIGERTYEFTKSIDSLETFSLEKFIDTVVSVNPL